MKKRKKIVKDFTPSDLPSNRKELFFDILKNQWNSLLILAFIFLLIFVPFIIFRYYNLLSINNILSSNNEDIFYQIKIASLTSNAINILIILFVGIFFSGIARIYKKLAYNDGFFLGADYVKGLKENVKDFIVLFLIYGIINFILESLSINYLIENSFLYYVFKFLNYGVFLPILAISVCISSIYNDPVFKKLYLSVVIYFKHLPKIALVTLIALAPLFILLIPSTTIQLFVPMLYCLIYLPLAYLLFVIVMNHIFDKEINNKKFPHLVNKGMYVK